MLGISSLTHMALRKPQGAPAAPAPWPHCVLMIALSQGGGWAQWKVLF